MTWGGSPPPSWSAHGALRKGRARPWTKKNKKALIEATAILENLNKNWAEAEKSQAEFYAKVDRFILVVDMLLLAVAVTMAVFHEPAMWR